MQKMLQRIVIAAFLTIAVAGCERKDGDAAKTAAAPGPFQVQTAAPQSASSGGTSPAASNAGDRIVALPDFTPLMKAEGPAVVDVISTNKAAPRRGAGAGENHPPVAVFRPVLP